MKKLLLTMACLCMVGTVKPMAPTATPFTQNLNAAALGVIAVGAGTATIGHFGAANTLGSLVAAALGYVGFFITDAATKALLTTKLLPLCMVANPMVAPIVAGAGVTALMFWLREQYLPAHSKDLEKLGLTILKLGIGLCALGTISYAANAAGYKFCVPLEKITIPIK